MSMTPGDILEIVDQNGQVLARISMEGAQGGIMRQLIRKEIDTSQNLGLKDKTLLVISLVDGQTKEFSIEAIQKVEWIERVKAEQEKQSNDIDPLLKGVRDAITGLGKFADDLVSKSSK